MIEKTIVEYLTERDVIPFNGSTVLLSSFTSLHHFNFAAELEIVENLIECGYKVIVLRCESDQSLVA